MKTLSLCVAIACAAAQPVAAADDAADADVVAFNASVRVEVDAAGKPVRIEAPADLPEAIRAFDSGRRPVFLDEPRRDIWEEPERSDS